MPVRGLPGNASLEHLRKGAKSFQRAVRAGDPGAAQVVREFHPRLADALSGSAQLAGFTRADAQLVVARQFGFVSWPKLKAHLELVSQYARSPHEQPVGGPLPDRAAVVDEFLRLVCLTYGDDDPARLPRAASILAEHAWLGRASIHTVAATGDVDGARELLREDPAQASLVGGPHRWEPLLYLAYARAPLPSGGSAVGVARLLLEHGADPNAGYLWEGLVPPFTALTGALGGGGTIPRHPEELALARLLLEAGANANDGQAIYNLGPDARSDWVKLLLEFGLGSGDGGHWQRLLGDRLDSPKRMIEDLLMSACSHGLTDRLRILLGHSVDPDGRGSRHPIYGGRSPVQEAALNGHLEVVSLLVDAGAVWEHDAVDELVAAATAGDRPGSARLLAADPGLRVRAIERSSDQLVRAAEQSSPEAVALLIELGFDVNAGSTTRPLHEAAMRGNVEMIELLLDHGADPTIRDRGYRATPAGWAEHHQQHEAQKLLEEAERAHRRAQVAAPGDAGVTAPPIGTAMRTVAAAFSAVTEGRFEELGALLADDIDWHGLPDEEGNIPRCQGRAQALARMQIGLLAGGAVSVSALEEHADRVLAHVHATTENDDGPPERFVVAEVHHEQITQLRGYATEAEARDALTTGQGSGAPTPATSGEEQS